MHISDLKLKFVALGFAAVCAGVFVRAEDGSAWPTGKDPSAVGRRLVERFLSRTPDEWNAHHSQWAVGKQIAYPTACVWDGALRFTKAVGDTNLLKRIAAVYDPFYGKDAHLIPPSTHVDFTMFGGIPLEVYAATGDRRALETGLAMANAQWAEPKPGAEAINGVADFAGQLAYWKDGYTPQTRLWIDDMFMISFVQLAAYRATGKRFYADRVAKEMALYLDRLQNPDGLFYHAPDVPFAWGRGNGWMAVGMTRVLECLPTDDPNRERILSGYRKMMATLLKWQRKDGLWGQLVDDPASWPETSGSGMFAYAFIEGARTHLLDAKYGAAGRRAYLALVDYLTPEGDVREVCVGTNKQNDRAYYLARPRCTGDHHGQAPLLWCCAALTATPPAGRMDRSKLLVGTYYLHPVAQTEAHVKAMKACGIDFVFGVDIRRREALDLLAKYGIGCIATGVFPNWGGGDGRYAGQLEKKHPLSVYTAAAKAFKDHSAIWMVDIGDEPSALEFPYYSRIISEIAHDLPSGVKPYLNLYPNYAQVTKNSSEQQFSQLGTATYDEHISRYANEIPLDYLSYDYYVYSAWPWPDGFDGFLDGMYRNFETVAEACRRTGRSFWYVPQMNSMYEGFHMSPNRLRFQAFTAMAYGAEVINWACWMKGWWNYNVLNDDGSVNEYEYLILKTVNRELHALGPDFMRYRNVATHRLGFAETPKALDLAAFKDIRLAEGGRLVVGEMTARTGAGSAFFAVNSDDPRDAGAKRQTLVFRPQGGFRVVTPTGVRAVRTEKDGCVRLPLAASEAVLVMED